MLLNVYPPFSRGFIKNIYTICSIFFWSSKHSPVAWKLVCRPIECGGLGLRSLKHWNKALLCKTLWHIQNKKDSLLIKWVSHYYTKDFWNYTPKSDCSTLLKSVFKLRNELTANGDSKEVIIARLKEWFDGSQPATAAAYCWFFNNHPNWPWKPIVHKPGIVPKHRISLWMFAHKKFLNKDRQGYIEDKKCVLFQTHDESFDHLFFSVCHHEGNLDSN